MLYNNKNNLSALALILAMSVTLAGGSYAQGVITLVDEDVDELGIENNQNPEILIKEEINIPENVATTAELPVEEELTIEEDLPIENAVPVPTGAVDLPEHVAEPEALQPENILPKEEDSLDIPLETEDLVDPQIDDSLPKDIDPAMEGKVPPSEFMHPDDPNMPFDPDMDRERMDKKQRDKKNRMQSVEEKKASELGNSVLSQIDNDLFSQMSDIEKQTTLLSLELRREKLKSEIDAIKAARRDAEQKAEEEQELREQRKKDIQAQKEIEKIKQQQLLEDKKIALEALRQEKALDDYRNKMLENEQKWINENLRIYNKMKEMEEEKKAIIDSFSEKLESLNTKSQEIIAAAEKAKENFSKTVENLNMQNAQLKKRLDAETSVGKNLLGDADADGQINDNTLNRDYVIMEIRGKGDDLIAKLINKNGESFLVKKGSVLQSGHKIEKITHNYITLDRNGVKAYLQFTAGGVVDKEPEGSSILPKAGNSKDAGMNVMPENNSRPPLLMDNAIPSLGNGMFVK